jgi:hypothetical protein
MRSIVLSPQSLPIAGEVHDPAIRESYREDVAQRRSIFRTPSGDGDLIALPDEISFYAVAHQRVG